MTVNHSYYEEWSQAHRINFLEFSVNMDLSFEP